MKITIGSFTLFDDTIPGWTISDRKGSIARAIQANAPIRASEIKTRYRGLKQTNVSFTVSRTHEDEAAMEEFLLFHEHDIPSEGVIRFIARRAAGSERVLYLSGHLEGLDFSHVGRRTFHTYRIIGGATSLTQPTA